MLIFFYLIWLFLINGQCAIINRNSDISEYMHLTPKLLNDSCDFAQTIINRLNRLETALHWAGIAKSSINSEIQSDVHSKAKNGLVVTRATQHLVNKIKGCLRNEQQREECVKTLMTVSLNKTKLHEICTEKKNDSNLKSYSRLLFPAYQDSVMQIRRSVLKKSLPSSHLISIKLFNRAENDGRTINKTIKNDELEDEIRTLAFYEWGEFIANDLVFTASSSMISTKAAITCCDSSGSMLSPRFLHPLCLPINVQEKRSENCLSYVRSLTVVSDDCSFGPMQQLNLATPTLDGSQLYGTSKTMLASLRSFQDGRLLSVENSAEEYLPLENERAKKSRREIKEKVQWNSLKNNEKIVAQKRNIKENKDIKFKSGDNRVNSNPYLSVIHTLFLREHNRISNKLKKVNPTWNDDELFQQSREIIEAIIQQITFEEWIPLLFPNWRNRNNKESKENSQVTNEFATVGIRFLNSMIPNQFNLYSEDKQVLESLKLKDLKMELVQEKFDDLIRGMAMQKAGKMDLQFADDLNKTLAIDIQRGRDHGLAPYVLYRKWCTGRKVDTFDDLKDVIPPKTLEIIKSLYTSVEDIDLIVGAFSESPTQRNFPLSPTLNCILLEQFSRTKQLQDEQIAKRMTKEQLAEVKKVTLAKIFCLNGNNIKQMQKNVFEIASDSTPLLPCSNYPEIDISKWKAY